MRRWIWGTLAILTVAISVPLTAYGLFGLHRQLTSAPSPQKPCRPPAPILDASASDGEVTLRWRQAEPAAVQGPTVKAWQYRQAVQGGNWSVGPSAGPATAYVVSDLTNGVAYAFQVRAQFNATDFSCWSAAVSVVPRRIDNVIERIEKHQEAIVKHHEALAGRMAEVVEKMDRGQELLKELSDRELAMLERVAISTSEIAKHSADIHDEVVDIHDGVVDVHDGVVKVAASVDTAGNNVVTAIAKQTEDIHEKMDELKVSVDAVGQKVEKGLDDIAEQIGKNLRWLRGASVQLPTSGNGVFQTRPPFY